MKQKSIYIILTRTTTVISRLISYMTGDRYTHASIALDENLSVMYSFGRRQRYNPLFGGFCQENMDEGVFADCKVLPYTVIQVKVTKKQYNKAKSIIQEYVQNAEQYSYNYTGLLFAWMGKTYKCSNRFYCSEFVYDLLKRCGVIREDQPTVVRPQELMWHGQITEEGDWRGKCYPMSSRTPAVLPRASRTRTSPALSGGAARSFEHSGSKSGSCVAT